jgi:3-hydroxybutyryl-CoA dehydrogenase
VEFQVAASAGIEVTLVDTSSHQLERALSSVKQSLEKLHSKGKLSEDPGSIASRLSTGTDIDALHRVDFAVEAVPEDEALKTSVLQHLDRCTPSHAILASNTSSISITRLGAATRRPHAGESIYEYTLYVAHNICCSVHPHIV